MAGGNFGGGDGSASSPFLVEDAQDLDAVRNDLQADYKQIKDIDLSSISNFIPIGLVDGSSTAFRGGYNGNGYLISNLKINSTEDNVGLFSLLNSSKILNISLVDCDVRSTGSNVGALAGHRSSGGLNNPGIKNSYTTGFVEGLVAVGGFIGSVRDFAAGLDCYSSCRVLGKRSVGGFVGSFNTSYGNRNCNYNCYSSGGVSGESSVGGFIGSGRGGIHCFALNPFVERTSGSSTAFGRFSSNAIDTSCFALDSMEFRG